MLCCIMSDLAFYTNSMIWANLISDICLLQFQGFTKAWINQDVENVDIFTVLVKQSMKECF